MHSQGVYFAIIRRGSQLSSSAQSLVKLSPAVQLKQLNAHAHSVAAICAVCHRARDIRKPWIISTCISLKHYVRTPLLAR